MLRVAGEVCDGVRLHPLCSRRYLEEVCLPRIARACSAAGARRENFDVFGGGFVVTGPDRRKRWPRAWRRARRRIGFYGSTRTYLPILALHGSRSSGLKLHAMSVEGRWSEMAAQVPDDVVRIFAACGTYSEIAGAIEQRYGGVAELDRPRISPGGTGRAATRADRRHPAHSAAVRGVQGPNDISPSHTPVLSCAMSLFF